MNKDQLLVYKAILLLQKSKLKTGFAESLLKDELKKDMGYYYDFMDHKLIKIKKKVK